MLEPVREVHVPHPGLDPGLDVGDVSSARLVSAPGIHGYLQ